MSDLVEKYFKEDLTEAEQQALSELLLKSDEAALKFEEKAKAAYGRYGLPEPEPHWPNVPGNYAPPGLGFGPWIGLTIFVLGIAGLVLWGYQCGFFSPNSSSQPVISGKGTVKAVGDRSPLTTTSSRTERGKNVSTHPSQPQEENPINDEGGQEIKTSKTSVNEMKTNRTTKSIPVVPVREGSNDSPSTSSKPAYTPVNVTLNPPKTFPGLAVEVNQGKLGFITVRVLDLRQTEVVVLYRGNLAAGDWMFQWDGQMLDGHHAPPGFYQIEVKVGSFVQTKKIQIQ